MDLLASPATSELIVELTSRCNLRCTYCAVAQPEYVGRLFPKEHLEELTRLILERRPRLLAVNGHGETTTVKDWDKYCRYWLDQGLELKIITNLAKELNEDEVNTLARFRKLIFSIDTADPELFEQVRQGASFAVFQDNLDRIVEASRRLQCPPELTFSTVVMDINAHLLPDLVNYGLARGITAFEFCNLSKYPDVEGAIRVRHVSELPEERKPPIRARLDAMIARLVELGVACSFPIALLEALGEGSDEGQEVSVVAPVSEAPEVPREPEAPAARELPEVSEPELGPVPEMAAPAAVETQAPTDASGLEVPAGRDPAGAKLKRDVYPPRVPAAAAGMTRHCLDPWKFAYVQADAAVRLCCFSDELIGALGCGEDLNQLLDNDVTRAYRKGLLTGDLRDACRNCWTRPWVSTDQLHAEVDAWVNSER